MTTNYVLATYTRKQRQAIENIRGIDRHLACLREMLTVAERHGDEYEIDRCRRQISEYEFDEMDAALCEAIETGLGPDDIDAL